MGGQIDDVLWRHKGNKMVEWDNTATDPTEYLTFKGRTVLNKITGDVTVRDLTKADSGDYEVEVLNQGMLRKISLIVEIFGKCNICLIINS